MAELRPYEIRANKNLHCTIDEIDERQTLELLVVLDLWEEGEMSPEDVIMHTLQIVGASDMNLTWEYAYSLRNDLPGTETFDAQLESAPEYIEEAWQNISRMNEKNALSSVEHMVERYNKLKPEIQEKWLNEEKERLSEKLIETGYKPLKRNTDLSGPRGYVDTVHALIAYRDELASQGNEYAASRAECEICDSRHSKDKAERDFNDLPGAIERIKQDAIDRHELNRERVRENFRSEVLEQSLNQQVAEHIAILKQKIDDLEINSWDAAIAIAQLILSPDAKIGFGKYSEQLEREIREEQERCQKEYAGRDARETFDKLQPETEADFIKRYGDAFADEAKYQRWRAQRLKLFDLAFPIENYPDTKEKGIEDLIDELQKISSSYVSGSDEEKETWNKIQDLVDSDRERKRKKPDAHWTKFDRNIMRSNTASWDAYIDQRDLEDYLYSDEVIAYFEKFLKVDQKNELARQGDNNFKSPFLGLTDILCNEMHISPSGTARIKLTPSEDDHEMMGYRCADTARITTYSISFKPLDPERAEELRTLVYEALEAVAYIEHPYFYSPNDDDSYERPAGRDGWRERYGSVSNHVYIEDGLVKVTQKLDLDDLYVLYYMLEPALELNGQITAAINSARFSEERGAVLAPDPFHGGQYDHGSYEIEEESGTLLGVPEEQLFAKSVRDAFVDLALGKIDQAGFTARLQIIADHTLTGKMQDQHRALPTYKQMIEDKSKEKEGALITYDDALKYRVSDIVRTSIGLSEDSEIPLSAAIIGFTHRIKPKLLEQFREAAADKQKKINHHYESGAWRQRYNREDDVLAKLAKKRREEAEASKEDPESGKAVLDWLQGQDMLHTLSDAFAGKTGGFHEDNALAFKGNIVVRDSEVETCIDGIYILNDGTSYRTRTKDSLLPRKDLPSKLKPYTPDHDPRQGFTALEFKAL